MLKKCIRNKKISTNIKKNISGIINEIDDLKHFLITISDVIISNDLSYAKIFVICFDKKKLIHTDETEIKFCIQTLNTFAKHIKYMISKTIFIRKVPNIKFIYDNSFVKGHYISNIIKKAVNK